jgi:hypothetical protein
MVADDECSAGKEVWPLWKYHCSGRIDSHSSEVLDFVVEALSPLALVSWGGLLLGVGQRSGESQTLVAVGQHAYRPVRAGLTTRQPSTRMGGVGNSVIGGRMQECVHPAQSW